MVDMNAPAHFPPCPLAPPMLSVVVPMHGEAKGMDALFARLLPVLEGIDPAFEVVCVDDGSRDATLERLRDWNAREPRVRAVSLSRNFGKEVAIAAGLRYARGDAVVIIDADLQHPPETIVHFVRLWREGYRNVYGVRRDRDTDGVARRAFTRAFYRLFDAVSPTGLPHGAGDFRLLDRMAVDALLAMPERTRFTKGLYAWIGFKSIAVEFDVEERADGGRSRFNFRGLMRLAVDGITAFSNAPLRVWGYVGLAISALAFLYASVIVSRALLFGIDVPGFTSLIVSVMFFAGVQLITLGVIGEYIGRIFVEVKRRPLYLVQEEIGVAHEAPIDVVGMDRRA
jgi:polyisoprenyl-phosphate glycosyltransferase